MTGPNRSQAVMAQRVEPDDSLDFFPTIGWVTRALIESALKPLGLYRRDAVVWEPAAGEGHMVRALAEYYDTVHGSDIFDYGQGFPVFDFLRCEPGRSGPLPDFLNGRQPDSENVGGGATPAPDWIITNPPFGPASNPRVTRFALAALATARVGCALFCRAQVLEGADRYRRLWRPYRDRLIWAQFVERVPIHKGRVAEGSSATATGWLIATRDRRFPPLDGAAANGVPVVAAPTLWIPPGQAARLTRPGDLENGAGFAARQEALL